MEKIVYVVVGGDKALIAAESRGNLSRAVVEMIHDGNAAYAGITTPDQIRGFRSDFKAELSFDEINSKLTGISVHAVPVYKKRSK